MLRLLSVSALLLLAACNGSEDFSDADLGGPVIQPSPIGDPFNPDATVTEVEFAAGGSADGDSDYLTGVVNNLGYSCGTFSGYIPRPGNTQGDGGAELKPNVARCSKDVTAITFFLGPAQSGQESKRVVLGTAQLPAESAQGRYQITPADLIESPSRLSPTDERAYFRAALIQALDGDRDANDSTENTPQVIDIPDEAHAMLTNPDPGAGTPAPPSPAFDYPSYNDFANAWQTWIGELDSREPANIMLPSETEAQEQLTVSLERLRGGTFNAQSLGLTEYGFVLQQLGRTQNIAFQLSTLVFPDGEAIGTGLSLRKGSDPQESIVALARDARMDVVNQLLDWNAGEISLSEPDVSIGLQGRVLGTFAYYVASSDRVKSDFDVDYPNSGYTPVAGDKARYTANGFGASVSDGLWWLTRTGQVAVNWDLQVVQALASLETDRFYDIEFRRPCSDSNEDTTWGSCPTYNNGTSDDNGLYEIPPAEFNLNYPERVDLDGSSGNDDPGVNFTHERAKEWGNDLNRVESLRVQILDNGDVVTDVDRDCSDTDPADYQDADGTQEYRVGFVTRTNRDSAGDPESFNVVLLMTGNKPGATDTIHAAHDEIPHYAVQVGGRIDVSGDAARFGNMYRLGDSNFADGIRGFWTDFYLPPQKEDKYGSSYPERHEIAVSASGSAEGNPVDSGTCTVQ